MRRRRTIASGRLPGGSACGVRRFVGKADMTAESLRGLLADKAHRQNHATQLAEVESKLRFHE